MEREQEGGKKKKKKRHLLENLLAFLYLLALCDPHSPDEEEGEALQIGSSRELFPKWPFMM